MRHLPRTTAFALIAALAIGAITSSAAAQREPERAASEASSAPREVSSADVIREIERSASRAMHTLGELRRTGSAHQARCVDATVSQITATLRLAIDRNARATRYEQRGDQEMAARERALIVRLRARTRELEREVRRCVAPDVDGGPNRTRVTTIIERWVPNDAIQEARTPGRLEAVHSR